MQTHNLVKDALKAKAPSLHKSLAAQGQLSQYAADLADQISDQVVTLTQAQRVKEGWDKLGPAECAAKMRTASSLHRELVLAQMLEFPQDETSPQNQDAITDSGLTT
jgi:hypothetical protein